MVKPTLGYWDLRGIAEPIRYILHYKKVDFEDKRYQFSNNEWKISKYSLGLAFPNLVYYIDEDAKLTQSVTILRYLAQKYDLEGRNDQDEIRIHLAEQQLNDLRWSLRNLVVRNDFESAKIDFIKSIPQKLNLWEKFLGERKYIAGDYITYVDFLAFETFDYYNYFHPNSFHDFPSLLAYKDRIQNLSGLQEYFTSSAYKVWPLFGPGAKFGI
ncbi:glutathione S-transferase [Trichonephila inaurata madagascariensis]|uniref:glutathione transferase n=1 Tax=Trichonephila inaurata madagascariensis TaxID=2747483 RepID=A0A8X6WV11_9ARAC|nr:glutathione S-transferase [Trichonephila inaurata madagascariensis]